MTFTAKLTITFTSNYIGSHRICWRIGGLGPYDCTTLVICSGGGASCSEEVFITIETDDCTPVDIDGYVQAACEAVGSLDGRIPFSLEFIPWEDCNKYTVECTSSPCVEITPSDCAGSSGLVIAEGYFTIGETLKMCSTPGPPAIPAGYSITQDSPSTCACNCQCYRAVFTGFDDGDVTVLIYFIGCDGNYGTQTVVQNEVFRRCVVQGSVVYKAIDGDIGTVTINTDDNCSEQSPTCE